MLFIDIIFVLFSLLGSGQSYLIDSYTVKEFLDFSANCPSSAIPGNDGPNFNITHSKDYEDFTVCWRFMLTAYCPKALMRIMTGLCCGDDILAFLLYPPRDPMTNKGRQCGLTGFVFNSTDKDQRPQSQIAWRFNFFENQIKIYEWQNMCLSYSKQNHSIYFAVNGEIMFDEKVRDQKVEIRKDFLSKVMIFANSRGSFADLQVYSKPMNKESLVRWTVCQYEEEGDVFNWDTNRLNMTIDESIVSAIEKVDSKSFCKSAERDEKEIHMFGDDGGATGEKLSYEEYSQVCLRLNGKAHIIPSDEAGFRYLDMMLHNFEAKTNITLMKWSTLWIGGRAKIPEEEIAHYYPEPSGVFAVYDPDSGDNLMTKENERFFAPIKESYHMMVEMCPVFQMTTNPDKEDPKIHWQKCSRKGYFGRIFCEFPKFPSIHIKGLCKESTMDRNYILLAIESNQGK